jgi:hypothetical protein
MATTPSGKIVWAHTSWAFFFFRVMTSASAVDDSSPKNAKTTNVSDGQRNKNEETARRSQKM